MIAITISDSFTFTFTSLAQITASTAARRTERRFVP